MVQVTATLTTCECVAEEIALSSGGQGRIARSALVAHFEAPGSRVDGKSRVEAHAETFFLAEMVGAAAGTISKSSLLRVFNYLNTGRDVSAVRIGQESGFVLGRYPV